MLNKIIFYIKQLFKLQYYSCYFEGDIKYVTTWKMWFGKCYEIKKYEVKNMNII